MRLTKARLSQVLAADPTEHMLLTPNEVAELLRVSPATVYRWRKNNSGPPFTRVGAEVRYFREELLAWVRSGEAANAHTYEGTTRQIAAGE